MPRHVAPDTRHREGQRLLELRARLGLSQRDFATELNATAGAIAQWEGGKRTIPGPVNRLIDLFEEELSGNPDNDRGPGIIPTGWVPRSARAAPASVAWFVLRHAFENESSGIRKRARDLALRNYVKTLAELKGLPMKIGQMQSYLAHSLAEPDRRALSRLCYQGTPLPTATVVSHITRELGQEPNQLFSEWSAKPLAVASIGQVHRARLPSGDEVAVKLQHPTIERALRRDLETLKPLASVLSALFGGSPGPEYDSYYSQFLGETDYSAEANNQQRFATIFADEPGIHIPAVFSNYSTRRILTTEFDHGAALDAFTDRASQEERNAAGSSIWNFYWTAALAHGLCNTDPQPANLLFHPEKVTFIDFGRVQSFDPIFVQRWRRVVRGLLRRDRAEVRTATEDFGLTSSNFDHNHYFRLLAAYYRPWLTDGPFAFTSDHLHHMYRLSWPDNPNKTRGGYHKDMAFIDQLFFGVGALLSQLGARVECRKQALPLVFEKDELVPAPWTPNELGLLGL